MNPDNMTPNEDQLRHALRTYAINLSGEHTPPQASLIWFRAERRRRRLAIERAERPLLIMQITGLICAACAIAWLSYRFAPHQLPTIDTTYLVLALACMLLILAGCSAMLLASRRPSSQ
jgi:peptidoglycan biosynthesis protein MviN/MurJ (putative lipid II flippase)